MTARRLRVRWQAPREEPISGAPTERAGTVVESNRARLAIVAGIGRGAGAEVEVPEPEAVVEPEEPLTVVEESVVQVDTAELGTGRTLLGHGGGPIPGPGSVSPGPGHQPSAPAGPDAQITLKVDSPKEIKKPEADIADEHDRPGVAGWTTPNYDVAVPALQAPQASINVTLGFDIELAEEYTGKRLDVLRDHEYGHVTIATESARSHLADGLEANLESLPAFIPTAPVRAAILAAAGHFVAEEGAESAEYDRADYPRMLEAYLGASTPLKDLAKGSREIQRVAKVLTTYAKSGSNASSSKDLSRHVKSIDKAWGNLSDIDLYRIQYNPDFGGLVAKCNDVTDELEDRLDSDDLEGAPGEDVELERQIDKMRDLLDDYEWEPAL